VVVFFALVSAAMKWTWLRQASIETFVYISSTWATGNFYFLNHSSKYWTFCHITLNYILKWPIHFYWLRGIQDTPHFLWTLVLLQNHRTTRYLLPIRCCIPKCHMYAIMLQYVICNW
jgi:hypothetical protein